MKKYKFTLSIGFVNARHEEVLEFDDDVTEDELEESWQEWSSTYIDGGFTEVK